MLADSASSKVLAMARFRQIRIQSSKNFEKNHTELFTSFFLVIPNCLLKNILIWKACSFSLSQLLKLQNKIFRLLLLLSEVVHTCNSTNITMIISWTNMRELKGTSRREHNDRDAYLGHLFNCAKKWLVAFQIETSHLLCSVKQMTGFYMEHETGLKRISYFLLKTLIMDVWKVP